MADLDELALSLPQTTKELSGDGRPSYRAHRKLFCCQRGRRPDAVDPQTGERLDDVLMFRVADVGVKELLLADDRDDDGRLSDRSHSRRFRWLWISQLFRNLTHRIFVRDQVGTPQE